MRWLIPFLLFLLLWPPPVRAEGPLSGGTRVYLEAAPLGPFQVSSFAAPNPPVITDRLWVTVQVRDGARAVKDATVWVRVQPQEGGAVQRVEATHELAAQPLDYTAALPVPVAGLYDVQVEVTHPQAAGEVAFVVRVSEPLTRYIFLIVGIPFAVAAVALGRRLARRPSTRRRGEPADRQNSRETLRE